MEATSLRRSVLVDANLDGQFDSSDLVSAFAGGKFEDDVMATWAEGDWNADLRFNSSDLVAAFADGGYESGPLAAQAVPEPTGPALMLMGLVLSAAWRRR